MSQPTVDKMRKLTDDYEAAVGAREPARERDIAFEMVQVLNVLYNAAYMAAAEQARREGKAG